MNNVNEKLNRRDAIAKGLKVYWKEKPCPQGHVGWTRIGGGCVECQKTISNNYKRNHKDELVEKRKLYLKSDDGIRAVKEYYERVGKERNRDYIKRRRSTEAFAEIDRVRSREYYHKNKDKLTEKRRVYLQSERVKEMNRVTARKWLDANSDRLRESRREYYRNYMRNRRNNDKDYKVYSRMRDFVRRGVEAINGVKRWRTKDILGYTPAELREHIESLWGDGMSWDNYGEWHIDHIKSIKAHVDEGVTDIRVINALSNLQPLWAFDNLSKGA